MQGSIIDMLRQENLWYKEKVQEQLEEINDLKIKIRLLKAKNEVFTERQLDEYVESQK